MSTIGSIDHDILHITVLLPDVNVMFHEGKEKQPQHFVKRFTLLVGHRPTWCLFQDSKSAPDTHNFVLCYSSMFPRLPPRVNFFHYLHHLTNPRYPNNLRQPCLNAGMLVVVRGSKSGQTNHPDEAVNGRLSYSKYFLPSR
jgi:hypothetical protein